jgi:hypothetical protein
VAVPLEAVLLAEWPREHPDRDEADERQRRLGHERQPWMEDRSHQPARRVADLQGAHHLPHVLAELGEVRRLRSNFINGFKEIPVKFTPTPKRS